jgi:uncharacterized zinc-type alcohol dehydrogenase-like protein
MKIQAYAAYDVRKGLATYAYEPAPLGPLDVELEITHCGICHTDLHFIDNDWGFTSYPFIPGHEIVGTIRAKGELVDGARLGQRVGVGVMTGGCFQCEWCLTGQDHLCPQGQSSFDALSGGFADSIRLDSRFAIPIPGAITSAEAAPLFCGGITVFSPLLHHGVNAHTRLGIVSIGGLGHLALQYGRALGCQTTAFSTTPSKEAESLHFGATKFINLQDEEQMAAQTDTLDFILTTASADLPWAALINVLRPNGTLCLVGIPKHEVHFPAGPFIFKQKRVIGSIIGSRDIINRMLAFSARNGVRPQIERFPMHDVNTALDRLRAGQVRYRIVLER